MRPRGSLIVVVVTRVVVSILFLAAGVGAFLALKYSRPTPPRNDSANEVQRVVVVEALERPAGRRWRAYGTAKALVAADVPAQVGAVVMALGPNYAEGATVAKGDVLLELDRADFEQQLSMATKTLATIEAQLDLLVVDERTANESVGLAEDEVKLARLDVQRAEDALARDAAMAREVDRLRQGLILAERNAMLAREALSKVPARRAVLEAERDRQASARDIAQRNLERCSVRSPIDGVLQTAEKDIGEMVQQGTRVARVVAPRGVEVPLLLPSSARPFLAVGSPVFLRPDRDGAATIEGHVARIAPEDDPFTRTVAVFAETDDAGVAPGGFVEAEVAAVVDGNRTVLPRRAVSAGKVLEVIDGRIQARSVDIEFGLTGLVPETGLPDTEWVVLREKLAPGTTVVLDASRQLADGLAIRPVAPDESARTPRTPEAHDTRSDAMR
ncbi:MAG: HlyD family efflux transporter periplasmic adaptor subunit [Phycisphaerae bacterium]|nr:HlyD family efflux transporter periplasmic adaptor subunit [Phycisphaerae bacterium]